MADNDIQQTLEINITLLTDFKLDIQRWFDDRRENPQASAELRSRINRNMRKLQSVIADAGCVKVVTLAPPPMVGGFIISNGNPFNCIFDNYHGMSMIPTVIDMIDATIGVMESPEYLVKLSQQPDPELETLAKGMQRVIQLCRRFPLVPRQLQ